MLLFFVIIVVAVAVTVKNKIAVAFKTKIVYLFVATLNVFFFQFLLIFNAHADVVCCLFSVDRCSCCSCTRSCVAVFLRLCDAV